MRPAAGSSVRPGVLLACVLAGAVACVSGLTGCASLDAEPSWHGERRVLAEYQFTTLSAQLPVTQPAEAVAAAAERALERRGHTIVRSTTSGGRSRVVAKPPRGEVWDEVVVTASQRSRSTRVTVEIKPIGDEYVSRAVFDSVVTGLGM
ncbi:MAG: hypothetical protein AAF356_02710 [Planctomycetota bacterium]